jgi:hypothetical protein
MREDLHRTQWLKEQDRLRTYNVIFGGVRVTIVAVEKQCMCL